MNGQGDAVIGWTEDELAAAVEAYRGMEERLASGSDIGKAKVYRELATRFGRSVKAWEYRMQNISHVLDQAREPWLPGLRPAANVGTKVELQLAKLLAVSGDATTFVAGPTRNSLQRTARDAEVAGEFAQRMRPTNCAGWSPRSYSDVVSQRSASLCWQRTAVAVQ